MKRVVVVLFIFVGIALQAAAPSASGQLQPAGGLSGTWAWSTHIGAETLPAMVTFHIDGTAIVSDSAMFGGLPTAPMKVGPLHGVWARTEPRRFGGTSMGILFDPATNLPAGFMRSRVDLEMSEDRGSLQGTMIIDLLFCPTAMTCPDPSDPTLTWAFPTELPVSARRVHVVPIL